MIDQITGIIWDWNGTLLNDLQLCVSTMNQLLEERHLPRLTTDGYREVFSFPVKGYYEKIGFDFSREPFEIPATEFITRYNEQMGGCSLHPDSVNVLRYFNAVGIKQFVLSAMQHDELENNLKIHGVRRYFEHVSGLDNHYATSKIENGRRLIRELNLVVEELVLIGDTLHDFEVAGELGCRCVLIANGHQSRQVLESAGVLVLDTISALIS
jgi:phosphoglycolate phosphatase